MGEVPMLVRNEGHSHDVREVLVGGDLGELDGALSFQMPRIVKCNINVLGLVA